MSPASELTLFPADDCPTTQPPLHLYVATLALNQTLHSRWKCIPAGSHFQNFRKNHIEKPSPSPQNKQSSVLSCISCSNCTENTIALLLVNIITYKWSLFTEFLFSKRCTCNKILYTFHSNFKYIEDYCPVVYDTVYSDRSSSTFERSCCLHLQD
jgi:hypothetical protein